MLMPILLLLEIHVVFASKKVERPSGRPNATILVPGSTSLVHVLRPQRGRVFGQNNIHKLGRWVQVSPLILFLLKMRVVFRF